MDLLVCSGAGGDVGLWREIQPQRLQQTGLLKVFNDSTTCRSLSWSSNNFYLACSPDNGGHVAVLSCDRNQVNLARQIQSKSLLEIGTADVGGVSSCCFLGNGHQLLIGLTSPLVSLWDIDTNAVVRNYVGHSSAVTCVSRNSKDTHLVSGVENGLLYLHKLSSSQPLTNLSAGVAERVICVKFSPSEHSMIGSCGNTGAVRLWSAESQRLLTTFSVAHTGGANDIAFSPYNRMLMASVGQNDVICLYDLIQRKTITQIPCPVSMTSILLLKDGVTMIGGAINGKLFVYNMRNCKEPFDVIEAHDKPIRSLAAQNPIKTKTGRKLPIKGSKKAVDTPIDTVNSPSNNDSPLMEPIATPATYNKANTSSVFSPLSISSSEAPLPVESTSIPVITSTQFINPSPNVIDSAASKKVSFNTETPSQAKLSSSIVDIFSPLNTSNVTTSRPVPATTTSVENKCILPPQKDNLTSTTNVSSFPSESTLVVNPVHSVGASTFTDSVSPSQLQSPQIQSTPALTILPRADTDKSPDPPISLITKPSPAAIVQTESNISTVLASTGQSLSPVQLQYLENMLKEQQEEITWSIHRDVNNLGVTMMRQFATLQNQMVLALTAISEKVEKLDEEVKHLKHQINHMSPKY